MINILELNSQILTNLFSFFDIENIIIIFNQCLESEDRHLYGKLFMSKDFVLNLKSFDTGLLPILLHWEIRMTHFSTIHGKLLDNYTYNYQNITHLTINHDSLQCLMIALGQFPRLKKLTIVCKNNDNKIDCDRKIKIVREYKRVNKALSISIVYNTPLTEITNY